MYYKNKRVRAFRTIKRGLFIHRLLTHWFSNESKHQGGVKCRGVCFGNHCTRILDTVSNWGVKSRLCVPTFGGSKFRTSTRCGGGDDFSKGFRHLTPHSPRVCVGVIWIGWKRTGHVVNSTIVLFLINVMRPVRVTQTIPLIGLQSYASNTRVSHCQCPTFRRLSLGRFLRRVRLVCHNGRTCWTFLKRVLSTPCVQELLNTPTPSAHGLSLGCFRYLT